MNKPIQSFGISNTHDIENADELRQTDPITILKLIFVQVLPEKFIYLFVMRLNRFVVVFALNRVI